MHAPDRPSLRHFLLAAAGVGVALAATLGLAVGCAHADGDPASDVLATQPLFLPWDADVPSAEQARLSALLEGAQHTGYPMRVALIASAADLGSVSALWRKPQGYAEFLDEELSLVYHGPLLVVMPNGFGVARLGLPSATVRAALAGIRVPHSGAQLAADTETAIRRLTTASGHRLAIAPTHTRVAAPSSSPDVAAWIVFVVGLALIALAWAASLRAQGLRARRSGTQNAW
jgi:hypothetical protein